MIYYLLLAYIKYQTKYKHSLLYLTRVIKECLFKRADIIDLLNLSLVKCRTITSPLLPVEFVLKRKIFIGHY